METARPGEGADGGNDTFKVVACLDSIAPRSRPQVPPSEVERIVAAGIAVIERSRAAARAAIYDDVRAYHRRVAEDIANYLADNVLHLRRTATPTRPGRPVPPSLSDLRWALKTQRKLTIARAGVRQAKFALRVAFAAPSGTPLWYARERRWSDLSRAKSRLADLLREATPS